MEVKMFNSIITVEPFRTPYKDVLKGVNKGKIIQIENGDGIRYKNQTVVNVVKDNFENHTIQLTAIGLVVVEDDGKKFFNVDVYKVSECKDDPKGKWELECYSVDI